MKNFQRAIKTYLDNLATTDPQFAEKYKNPKKTIEECCQYIVGEVRSKTKGSTAVMNDEEVYGMAIHYYDEDNITIRKTPKCSTSTSQELSEKDKKQLREQAEKEYKEQLIAEFKQKENEKRQKQSAKRKSEESLFTGSLF